MLFTKRMTVVAAEHFKQLEESTAADQAVVFDLSENEIIHTSITVGDFDEACTESVSWGLIKAAY